MSGGGEEYCQCDGSADRSSPEPGWVRGEGVCVFDPYTQWLVAVRKGKKMVLTNGAGAVIPKMKLLRTTKDYTCEPAVGSHHVCMLFQRGRCHYGTKCHYTHVPRLHVAQMRQLFHEKLISNTISQPDKQPTCLVVKVRRDNETVYLPWAAIHHVESAAGEEIPLSITCATCGKKSTGTDGAPTKVIDIPNARLCEECIKGDCGSLSWGGNNGEALTDVGERIHMVKETLEKVAQVIKQNGVEGGAVLRATRDALCTVSSWIPLFKLQHFFRGGSDPDSTVFHTRYPSPNYPNPCCCSHDPRGKMVRLLHPHSFTIGLRFKGAPTFTISLKDLRYEDALKLIKSQPPGSPSSLIWTYEKCSLDDYGSVICETHLVRQYIGCTNAACSKLHMCWETLCAWLKDDNGGARAELAARLMQQRKTEKGNLRGVMDMPEAQSGRYHSAPGEPLDAAPPSTEDVPLPNHPMSLFSGLVDSVWPTSQGGPGDAPLHDVKSPPLWGQAWPEEPSRAREGGKGGPGRASSSRGAGVVSVPDATGVAGGHRGSKGSQGAPSGGKKGDRGRGNKKGWGNRQKKEQPQQPQPQRPQQPTLSTISPKPYDNPMIPLLPK